MNPEQIQKSIKQMKDFFQFFTILQLLGVFIAIGSCIVLDNSGNSGIAGFILFPCALLALGYSDASRSLRTPNPKSYNKALQASIVLLLGFPVFTFFGISYLRKLSKPEMKQVFGKG